MEPKAVVLRIVELLANAKSFLAAASVAEKIVPRMLATNRVFFLSIACIINAKMLIITRVVNSSLLCIIKAKMLKLQAGKHRLSQVWSLPNCGDGPQPPHCHL